jgi:hypothetical protein
MENGGEKWLVLFGALKSPNQHKHQLKWHDYYFINCD